MSRNVWILIAGCLAALPAVAAADEPVSIGERITLHSEVLGEDRVIYVRTPDGYDQSPAPHPILYLTDGDTQFVHTAATVQFLARNGRIPDMFVVGIGNTNRTRDLTPTAGTMVLNGEEMVRPGAGGADRFLAFIERELMPYMDRRFRPAPYRLLAGHSLGGLFATHVFQTRTDLFNAYVAVSPALMWDKGTPLRRFEQMLAGRERLDRTYVVTVGREADELERAFESARRLLDASARQGLVWQAERFADEDHGSVVLRSHYLAFRKIFEDWPLPRDEVGRFTGALDDFEAHFAKLTKRLGFPVAPSEAMVNVLGYEMLAAKRLDVALAFFARNVREFPESANVYDSHGEGLEAAGRLREARDRYAEAVRRGEAAKDPNLPIYQEHLDAVTQKLGSS